jgi:hypothetical protein
MKLNLVDLQFTEDVVIKEAPHKKVFEEIKQTHELHHVETADKSAPVIEKDIKIGEAPHKKLFEEIKQKGAEQGTDQQKTT